MSQKRWVNMKKVMIFLKNSWRKVAFSVIAGLVALLLLCYLPDILFKWRNLLKSLPVLKNLICDQINDSKYIELMLVPLLNCIAITISIFALHTAKSTNKTQILQQKAKIIKASSNMREIVENNMMVVHNLQKNQGDIQELLIDKNAIEDAACLYSEEKITIEELAFFKEFIRKVSNINNLHRLGKDEDKEKEINSFCQKYFKENTVEYIKELRTFVDNLDQII